MRTIVSSAQDYARPDFNPEPPVLSHHESLCGILTSFVPLARTSRDDMVRTFEPQDMERVLDIWLRASIKAHDFIDASYWQSNVVAMRELYIPASQTIVIEDKSAVQGFCSLLGNQLAALFVDPDQQGRGLGRQLLEHVKSLRTELSLAVYKENSRSIAFYQSQGFTVIKEQIDPQTGHAEYLMSYKSHL